MIRLKITTLIVFALLAIGQSKAQIFKDDYSKMEVAYTKLTDFSCEISVNMFEKNQQEKPDRTMRSSLKKKGNNYYTHTENAEVIVNDDCMIYVNKQSKQLIYNIRDKKREIKPSNLNPFETIDSLLKNADSVVFKKNEDGLKCYVVYDKKSPIQKIDIAIDQSTFLLRRLTYHYDPMKFPEAEKVEIRYEKIDLEPKFENAEFAGKEFVSLQGKSLKPTERYRNYSLSLIDQRNLK